MISNRVGSGQSSLMPENGHGTNAWDGDIDDEEPEDAWETFLHINGISIYTEKCNDDGCGEDSAVMSSVVVRSTPKSCLRALLQSGTENANKVGGNLAFSDTVEVLRKIDAQTAIVRLHWSTAKSFGFFCAAREATLLRTWRRESDGTYVIIYQSAENTNLTRRRKSLKEWLLGCPVEADVHAAGFTIAPLRAEYMVDGGELCAESLVTLIVKADVGGLVSKRSLFSYLAPNITSMLRMSILQPLLLSLVLLRDRLEQSRFVVMPSMLSHDEEEELEGIDEDLEYLHYIEDRAPIEFLDTLTSEDGMLSKDTVAPMQDLTVFGKYGSCEKRFWSFPGVSGIQVRGKEYLKDRIKVPAKPPIFDLYSSDLIDSDELLWHVARGLPSVQYCDAPYAFILNLIFPNNPLQSLVTVWTCQVDPTQLSIDELVSQWNEDDSDGSLRAFFKNFKEWVKGDSKEDDARRNTKFKLIPRVARGSWVVRQSVGTTPVLLGQKLVSKYFQGRTARGCSYFEMDVDITSNTVANSVTKLVVNSITSLVVDLSPLIEGQDSEELPERLIGSVRYDHLNLYTAATWDELKQTIVPRIPRK